MYVLSGWAGSALAAFLRHKSYAIYFQIPTGKYYLADAGFASCHKLLTPYCGEQYPYLSVNWSQ
jgi:hypothetical protein